MDTSKAGTILNRNPLVIYALVQSLLTLALVFGFSMTAEQIGAILSTTTILLAMIANTQLMPISTANAKIEEALNTTVVAEPTTTTMTTPNKNDGGALV